MTRHEVGRLVSSQIYKDLMDKKLEDEMMDKSGGHLKICLWNKDKSSFYHLSVSRLKLQLYTVSV